MSDERSTPRREFLGQVAASAIVLAGAACATPAATTTEAAPAAPPQQNQGPGGQMAMPPAPTTWDDSWFGRITAKHKAVFDSPMIEDGLVLSNASGYIRGMRDAIHAGENDVIAVIVLRHQAVAMFFNDAMWEKYEIGKLRNIKEPRSEKFATKNPFIGTASARPESGSDRPQANLSWFASRGHIILGCDLATRNVSGVIARQIKGDARAVYADLCANMTPGTILQPTGVYACHRAQEAGCSYIRST
ncbi:MAG TPA: hypothetical protein VIP11_27500 [Gemmatimonadaceae bacterium]